MPTYNFMARFVPYVQDKTKTCTIRKIRKYPPRKGQKAYLQTGSRFKPKALFPKADAPDLVMVHTVYITEECIYIDFNEVKTQQQADKVLRKIEAGIAPEFLERINDDDKDQFAWMDGFRHTTEGDEFLYDGCFKMMMDFWKETHTLPFAGHISYWQHENDLPF